MKIRAFSVISILLLFAVSLGVEHVMAETRTFYDKGTIYTVSENSIITSDLQSGITTLTNADGTRTQLLGPTKSITDPGKLKISGPWLISGDNMRGACSAEAATLAAAAQAVDSACGNGGEGTAACSAAILFYDEARNAFEECLRVFYIQQ